MTSLLVLAMSVVGVVALVWRMSRPQSPGAGRLWAASGWAARGTVLGLLAVALLAGALSLGAFRAPITFVRDDGNTLISLTVRTAPMTWTGVSSVVEKQSSVTVTVTRIGPPLSWFAYDAEELLLPLDSPLGTSAVIDGATGEVVARN